jgi:hypothetical protein
MGFAARHTELRRFAGKICQTVEETVKGLTRLLRALARGVSRSTTKESSRRARGSVTDRGRQRGAPYAASPSVRRFVRVENLTAVVL